MPNGWKEKHLKEILDVSPQNGFSPQCVDYETGRFVLGLGNLTDYGLVYNELKNVPVEETRINSFQLQNGDFLISRSNTPDKVGRVGVFRSEVKNCFYPDLMMRFRINEKVANIDFIEKVLTFPETQKYYQKCSAGSSSSMVKINNLTVQKTPILLPPLPEQKAIADLLSTWDSAIEKTERLIAAKEKRFQWLLDELINQNLNKHNWKNSSFAEIFEPSKNKYDASGELPVLSVTKDGIVLQSEYFNKEIASDDLNGYLIVDYNDFVMSGLNFWMGSVDFQTIVEQGIVSPAYKVYKVKTNSVTIDYLKFFVRSTSMTKLLITSSVMGASIVRRNLDMEMLGNSVIKIPSPMEQEKIVSSLNLSNRELVALRNILSKYKEQKRGLMQKLLTGEWRVKI